MFIQKAYADDFIIFQIPQTSIRILINNDGRIVTSNNKHVISISSFISLWNENQFFSHLLCLYIYHTHITFILQGYCVDKIYIFCKGFCCENLFSEQTNKKIM